MVANSKLRLIISDFEIFQTMLLRQLSVLLVFGVLSVVFIVA